MALQAKYVVIMEVNGAKTATNSKWGRLMMHKTNHASKPMLLLILDMPKTDRSK